MVICYEGLRDKYSALHDIVTFPSIFVTELVKNSKSSTKHNLRVYENINSKEKSHSKWSSQKFIEVHGGSRSSQSEVAGLEEMKSIIHQARTTLARFPCINKL